MPTILIGGYYGAGNIGDEAILVAMIGELRAQRPDLSFIVTSWEPEKTSHDLDVDAIYWKDINALLDAALYADLIILGGGGIFHDYWGIDPDTYLRKGFWDITAFGSLPLLAKLLDIPCMIYAVGVGPFQSDMARQHTRIAFERCQIATLRDGESLEFLEQTGFNIKDPNAPIVKVLPDPVFSLVTSSADDADVADFLSQRQIETGTPLLGISLRYWDLDCPLEEWLPFVANGVRKFLKKNNQTQVILIPFQVLNATPHTNDAIVLKMLADLINISERIHLIEEQLTPQFAQALIKRCTVIVGMRLHSVIMGINVGTPVVALSYAPKVWSIMKHVGLEKFCNASLTPTAGDLAAQIKDAWNQSDEFSLRIKSIREELKTETKEHARLALDLLSRSHRSELQFPQQFSLQQVRLLLQADEKLASLQKEKDALEQSVQTLSAQLGETKPSLLAQTKEFLLDGKTRSGALVTQRVRDFLVLSDSRRARILRRGINLIKDPLGTIRGNRKLKEDLALIRSSGLFDETWYLAKNPDVAREKNDPLMHYLQNGGLEGRDPGPQFCSNWYLTTYKDVRKAGINPLLHYLKYGTIEGRAKMTIRAAQALPLQIIAPDGNNENSNSSEIVRNVINALNDRPLKGIAVVVSAFVFNELYNQRDINLCKTLSAQGWGVIFVAWRWNNKEAMSSIGDEVYKNIFQIPKDMLLENPDVFFHIQLPKKYFIIEFPHPDFLLIALKLRSHDFKIVYEIIDDWEEFHKVGHASWFNKSIENSLVINANSLTAVSRSLIEKFSDLRQDIYLSPNGYSPALLGEKNRNIARRRQIRKDEIHLGYFGYFAEAWFDWDFLLNVLDLAQEKNLKIFMHMIGYGEPDSRVKLAKYSDRVKFYGKIHPSDLYQYAKMWDAAIIWFKSGKLSEAVSPIKIYEYLYFGLPVLVKGISHLKDFPSTQVVTDAKQAVDVLIALQNKQQEDTRVAQNNEIATEQMLAESTWEQRFIDLLSVLENKKWISL